MIPKHIYRHHFKRLAPKREVLEFLTISKKMDRYSEAIRTLALTLEKWR